MVTDVLLPNVVAAGAATQQEVEHHRANIISDFGGAQWWL
jgi:hypothetical protein